MNSHKCILSIFVLVLIISTGVMMSMAQQPNPQMMQEKLATVKQAAAAKSSSTASIQMDRVPAS